MFCSLQSNPAPATVYRQRVNCFKVTAGSCRSLLLHSEWSWKRKLGKERKQNYVIKNDTRKKNSDYYYLSNKKVISVTSRSLQSIARLFKKRFREVFGNALILIFYLFIKAWREKSLTKSHLGWFFLVFGKGKATKENISIFLVHLTFKNVKRQ